MVLCACGASRSGLRRWAALCDSCPDVEAGHSDVITFWSLITLFKPIILLLLLRITRSMVVVTINRLCQLSWKCSFSSTTPSRIAIFAQLRSSPAALSPKLRPHSHSHLTFALSLFICPRGVLFLALDNTWVRRRPIDAAHLLHKYWFFVCTYEDLLEHSSSYVMH